MKILLTGCSGLIGSALLEELHTDGQTLRCLQRNRDGSSQGIWDLSPLASDQDEPFTAVIHLAGENVSAGRWNKVRKHRIMESRVKGTRELIEGLATLPTPPKTFICASAIGFYGSRRDEMLTEASAPGNGFLAEVCRRWETEAKRAEQFGARVVHLRFGMVLSPNGGALQKMVPPFKAGLGGPIGRGKHYMSWISIRDLVRIVSFVLHRESLHGPVNVVSSQPVTNKEFTASLAAALGKPAIVPAPPLALRLLFGEMADELLLASTRAKPEKLLSAGFRFHDDDLTETLRFCSHPR